MSERYSQGTMARATKISLALLVFIVVAGFLLYVAMAPDQKAMDVDETKVQVPVDATSTVEPPTFTFVDVTESAGIDFVHTNGAYGERLLPETMGGGVAVLDFDNDGYQDIYLVNSNYWPWHEYSDRVDEPHSALYHNKGDGTFERVTNLDLSADFYGMGVAVGDFDADGYLDLFETAVGKNRLLRNVQGKRFVDVSSETGVAGDDHSWSTCASFLDFDNDGDLDLFVCNYVKWSPDIDRAVDYQLVGVGRAYGPPTDFSGDASMLYRNDDGKFVDVTETAGINVVNIATGQSIGKALAVLAVDLNADGWTDLVVANDTVRNFVYINETDGTFSERGIEKGIAFDPAGLATGAMGIDVANFDNDQKVAIAIGNFANEMSSFFVQRGDESVFSDDAIILGVGAPSRRALTFGVLFLDLDLDGRQELISVNGHVEPAISQVQGSQSYQQFPQLFWNCGDRCRRMYELVTDEDSSMFTRRVARGIANLDLENDGDVDLIITEIGGGRATLLRNDSSASNNWIRFRLEFHDPNRFAFGSVVAINTDHGTQRRVLTPSRGYLSQVELPMLFGLSDQTVNWVEVTWPDGSLDRFESLSVKETHVLRPRN